MYYTGVDPRTMRPVYVPRSPHEKALQRALIQYRRPENYDLVAEALRRAHRTDLIGYGPKCLIRPTRPKEKGPGEGGGRAGRGGRHDEGGGRPQGAGSPDRRRGRSRRGPRA